jgi:hypothetical protein
VALMVSPELAEGSNHAGAWDRSCRKKALGSGLPENEAAARDPSVLMPASSVRVPPTLCRARNSRAGQRSLSSPGNQRARYSHNMLWPAEDMWHCCALPLGCGRGSVQVLDPAADSEREAIALLRMRLQAVTGTSPDDERVRLEIIDRIAQHENSDREFVLKEREQGSAVRQWRANTPLVIALTGLLTIAANFSVSYFLKGQEGEQQLQLALTNASLTKENTRLSSELEEAKAQSAQLRQNETRGLEFQYTMIDKIMSVPPSPDLPDEEVEKLRARQIGFLLRMGLMDKVDKPGFSQLYKSLTGEELENAAIGFPTLPRADDLGGALGSRWTSASRADVARVLGEPGTADCPIPLVDIPVPFDMVFANDGTQKISTIRVHEATANYFKKALQLIMDRKLEGEARLFGGAYVARNVANTRIPSFHAWGAAIDFDPAGNPFDAGRDNASLSTSFAQTMEEAGFLSHGLLLNRDWMHFEISRETLSEIESSGYVPPTRNCPDRK